MLNYESKGSELLNVDRSSNRSTSDVIINEDWSIVVEVTRVSGKMVYGTKVWDEGAPKKEFCALWMPSGRDIDLCTIVVGSYVVFHRVGEFEGTGAYGFELHEKNTTKTSWLCLGQNPSVFIKYVGGEGKVVEYLEGAWVEIPTRPSKLPIIYINNSSFYGTPVFPEGTIIPGKRIGDNLYVYFSGYGPPAKTHESDLGGATLSLTTDSVGRLLGVTIT